jgi:dihydropteroate synthase
LFALSGANILRVHDIQANELQLSALTSMKKEKQADN